MINGLFGDATEGGLDGTINVSGYKHKIPPLLTMFISLDPLLPILDDPSGRREEKIGEFSYEDENMMTRAERWVNSYRCKLFAQFRVIFFKGMIVEGNDVFITRFIHPVNPPDILGMINKFSLPSNPSPPSEGGEISSEFAGGGRPPTLQEVFRFVSLIPYDPDIDIFEDRTDVWLTCKQFLDILTGDSEEHALLLCNYFLYLFISFICLYLYFITIIRKINAYICMGWAFPEGASMWVITYEENGKLRLWNPKFLFLFHYFHFIYLKYWTFISYK
jgi:coiled-coil and C2 domain-containing protein 2A